MARLRRGDPAPDFSLLAQDGRRWQLGDFRGRQTLIVFFYPRDHTPVCTREACGFRDATDDFRQLGAALIGVSADDVASHSAFAADLGLGFPLLSDADGAVRRAYGVTPLLGLLPARVTVVIDRAGMVYAVIRSQFSARQHVQQALEAARALAV